MKRLTLWASLSVAGCATTFVPETVAQARRTVLCTEPDQIALIGRSEPGCAEAWWKAAEELERLSTCSVDGDCGRMLLEPAQVGGFLPVARRISDDDLQRIRAPVRQLCDTVDVVFRSEPPTPVCRAGTCRLRNYPKLKIIPGSPCDP